jgi:hypothetical protein
VDNIPQQANCIILADDRAEHNAEVTVG